MNMNSIIRNLGIAATLALPVLGQQAAKPVKKGPAIKQARAKAARSQQTPDDAVQAVPTPGKASGGNTWFPVTVRELGTFYGSGEAIGKFDFTNPQQTDVDWVSLTPSCQCARAEILIGEGQSHRVYRVISKPQKRLVRVTRAAGEPERREPRGGGGGPRGALGAPLGALQGTGSCSRTWTTSSAAGSPP